MKVLTVLATLAFAFVVQANEQKPATTAAPMTPAVTRGEATPGHTGIAMKKKKVPAKGTKADAEKKDEKTH